jgi:hypothetical protein
MQDIVRTARTTGLWYSGLALTGMLGFLFVRAQLHVPGAPDETLANLVGREGLARLGIALELGIVLTQALVAIWFFKLFRTVHVVAATAIAAFGLVNAAAILASSAALSTALAVALEPALAPAGDAAAAVQALYALSNGFWSGGAVFFGLWLIPMGLAVIVSRWMPRALGYVLIAGGVGYVASAFVQVLLPDATLLHQALTMPATVGEFWILGYLIVVGVRTPRAAAAPAVALPNA